MDGTPIGDQLPSVGRWVKGPPFAGSPPHILDLVEPRLGAAAAAVVDSEGVFGYRALDEASGAVARLLLARGVRRDEPVVVHATASRWAVAAMLGVLRAGSRYVPVDAGFPEDRQRRMAERSGARFALVPDEPGETDAQQRPWGDSGPERVPCGPADLGPADLGPADLGPADLGPAADGAFTGRRGTLAYTCFTSGSTGLPEPVTVPATALGWSTAARLRHYTDPVGVFLLCSSISFDSSMAGIWWTLATGGTLVIPEGRPGDLLATARAAERHGATHLLMVPSLYGAALRGGLAPRLRTLTTVIVAGESCPPALVARHMAELPQAKLHNEYGPTECTVWATVHTCTPADARARTVPIGRPVTGVCAYLAPGADGGPGELWLAGPGLADTDAPTARNRFVTRDGTRCFRTGDLVTLGDGGELLFHGRSDHQLKLGGLRVERGEIEQALTACDGVVEAGVGLTATARPRPIGFVVTAADEAIDVQRIRTQLLRTLPTTALPARVIAVPALPRLPNGKVDHGTLDHRAATGK
ncbi:amino acid adenylation domain-containing protein [Streptomyces sp. NPDC041068]|uniref:amino acid adenylation domain-containing protein n=1 Tax=Streptomyces sp. NPDC041068 TaxID=3155130 RepID=UPI0033C420AA